MLLRNLNEPPHLHPRGLPARQATVPLGPQEMISDTPSRSLNLGFSRSTQRAHVNLSHGFCYHSILPHNTAQAHKVHLFKVSTCPKVLDYTETTPTAPSSLHLSLTRCGTPPLCSPRRQGAECAGFPRGAAFTGFPLPESQVAPGEMRCTPSEGAGPRERQAAWPS